MTLGAVTHICVPNQNDGCSLPNGLGTHCIITAGTDMYLRYWDILSKVQLFEMRLSGTIACMDLQGDLLVTATRVENNPKDQSIQIFHLSNPQKIYRQLKSPLTHQLVSISCFPDQKGTI